MRLTLAILALALSGCSGAQQPQGSTPNLTIGTAQCSKHSWGTSAMAACLDRAAESQSATVAEGASGGNG
ncbi:MAG: hypothetical protein J0J10_19215 [Bosea sp.]|uniref:hypothetical protein n=1 Tax=Bosea sp. (in: a-proteobacteria) TaxID=1871050 RepID=UPI001ACDFADB|nr:hypothetical protein [Bosea sp. (in: a-proteobacteria)]MBN9470903.1 hypothetical protein [Bosea sp. (in: a-proteobacteria)]